MKETKYSEGNPFHPAAFVSISGLIPFWRENQTETEMKLIAAAGWEWNGSSKQSRQIIN